jgi:hypothetical protein
MLHGKEAESEAIVGGKPGIRVSLQEYPTGLVPQGPRGRIRHRQKITYLEIPGRLLYQTPQRDDDEFLAAGLRKPIIEFKRTWYNGLS